MFTAHINNYADGQPLQCLESATRRGLFEYCASEYGACIGKRILRDGRRFWLFGSCAERMVVEGERSCLEPFIVSAMVEEKED